MKHSYSEFLEKTMRVRTAYLKRRDSLAYQAAESTGAVALLQSDVMADLAEALSGLTVVRPCEVQAIRYGEGDYAGPHNDNHPDMPDYRSGYLDLHISVPSAGVGHQWLVFAAKDHFTTIVDVGTIPTINISYLPFWHYTTPLAAKPRSRVQAFRWLLLASFAVRQGRPARNRVSQ